jgi:hypothetical protein
MRALAVRRQLATRRLLLSSPQSGPNHFQCHRDIASRGVRVRADLVMRLVRKLVQIVLRQALVLDAQRDGKAESAELAGTD